MEKKRWLAILNGEQVQWIKNTAEAVGISGSAVVGEALNKVMKGGGKEFKGDLLSSKLRLQLQAIDHRIKAAEQEKAELLKNKQLNNA